MVNIPNHLTDGSDTMDDHTKNGGPEVVRHLCSFYQDALLS